VEEIPEHRLSFFTLTWIFFKWASVEPKTAVHFRAVLRTFLKKRRKVDFEQWQLSRFNTDDIYYFCPIKPPRSVVAPLDDLEKFDNPIML
jgi:hypothetical protein